MTDVLIDGPDDAPATLLLAHGAGTVHLLCAVHNGERYLSDFLDSVQAQTYTDWQLWLFNDASRDGSAALLAAVAQADVRVTVLPECDQPLGVVGAFAQLWAHVPATAPYIGCADPDDVWHPEQLARALAALRARCWSILISRWLAPRWSPGPPRSGVRPVLCRSRRPCAGWWRKTWSRGAQR